MNDISLVQLLHIAVKRIWILLLCAALLATCMFCYCNFFTNSRYLAKSVVIVSNGGTITGSDNKNTAVNNNDILASINLVETVVNTLQTKDIYRQMADNLNNRYTYQQLSDMATISSRSDKTLFVEIAFRTGNSSEAIRLANSFADLVPGYVTKYIPYTAVSVIDRADHADKVYPKTMSSTVLAGIIGALLAYVIVFIVDISDKAIKGEAALKAIGIPLLGVVPDFESSENYVYGGGNYGYGEKK